SIGDTGRGGVPVCSLVCILLVAGDGRIDQGIHRFPRAGEELGSSSLKYCSLMRANGGMSQPLNAALRWWLKQSTPIPRMDSFLKMPRIMIPRHHFLAKPGLHSLDVFGSRGTYAHGGSQAPPVPCPGSTLPVVIRNRLGIDIKQFRHMINGDLGNVFGGCRKASFQVKKLQRGCDPDTTAGISGWGG